MACRSILCATLHSSILLYTLHVLEPRPDIDGLPIQMQSWLLPSVHQAKIMFQQMLYGVLRQNLLIVFAATKQE